MDTVSEEAILESIEESEKTSVKEEGDIDQMAEKDQLLKELLKKVLNKEMSMEEYQILAEDIKALG